MNLRQCTPDLLQCLHAQISFSLFACGVQTHVQVMHVGWWWVWDSMFFFQYKVYKPAEFWMEYNLLMCKPRKWCYNSYRCKISPTDGFVHFSQILNVGFALSVKTHFCLLTTGLFFVFVFYEARALQSLLVTVQMTDN